MKIFGFGLIVSMILIGCGQTEQSQPKSFGLSPADKQKAFDYLLMTPQELQEQVPNQAERARYAARNAKLAEGTSCEKLDALWATIRETAEAEDRLVEPQIDAVIPFHAASNKRIWQVFQSFRHKDTDAQLPNGDIYPREHTRLTHRHGVFAQFRLVIDPAYRDQYTGFMQGSECVLGRFSSAVSPGSDRLLFRTPTFTPSFSAKFFADGAQESPSLISMHTIAGQGGNMNFFHGAMSNKLKLEFGKYDGAIPAFSRFYNTLQDFAGPLLGSFEAAKAFGKLDPRELSVQQLGQVGPHGAVEGAPRAPRFLFLVKSDEFTAYQYPEGIASSLSRDADYRLPFLKANHDPSIRAGLKSDGTLVDGPKVFDVYAGESYEDLMIDGQLNTSARAVKIGYLQVKSAFTVSDAADLRVYFKHTITPRRLGEVDYSSDAFYPREYNSDLFGDEFFSERCTGLGATRRDMIPNGYLGVRNQGNPQFAGSSWEYDPFRFTDHSYTEINEGAWLARFPLRCVGTLLKPGNWPS